MRVTCATVEEFLTNLGSVQPSDVFQQRVYVSRTPRRVDEAGVKIAVTLHASAVISLEGGEYLLDYGEDCGLDYEDASQQYDGTNAASMRKAAIAAVCERLGLKVMPGVVDY